METFRPGKPLSSGSPEDAGHGSVRAGGSRGFRALSDEERALLGRRGEEWAYAAESQRLLALGLDTGRLEREGSLEWVARRDKYAPYDIRSVEKADGDVHETYIEVKSTTGEDRSVEWSIQEFRYALSVGERYWLYWVAHVDQERPDPPVRYQDPVRLWKEGLIRLEFRQLAITLPDTAEGEEPIEEASNAV